MQHTKLRRTEEFHLMYLGWKVGIYLISWGFTGWKHHFLKSEVRQSTEGSRADTGKCCKHFLSFSQGSEMPWGIITFKSLDLIAFTHNWWNGASWFKASKKHSFMPSQKDSLKMPIPLVSVQNFFRKIHFIP